MFYNLIKYILQFGQILLTTQLVSCFNRARVKTRDEWKGQIEMATSQKQIWSLEKHKKSDFLLISD